MQTCEDQGKVKQGQRARERHEKRDRHEGNKLQPKTRVGGCQELSLVFALWCWYSVQIELADPDASALVASLFSADHKLAKSFNQSGKDTTHGNCKIENQLLLYFVLTISDGFKGRFDIVFEE